MENNKHVVMFEALQPYFFIRIVIFLIWRGREEDVQMSFGMSQL